MDPTHPQRAAPQLAPNEVVEKDIDVHIGLLRKI